jgi:urea transport system ATP-binding protein
MSQLLNLRAIDVAYGKSQVLWDVALDMKKGEAGAILGRNGVGKTTLLKAIVGQLRLMRGQIFLNELDVSRHQAHQRARTGIGFVPQGRHVFPHLTVEENLNVGLSALSPRKGKHPKKVPPYIFDLFPKLKDISQRKAGVLSGGEQQQLAIGRALAGRPDLLILDEPTEGIQPNIVQQIESALSTIRTELGVGVLIVEQNLDFAWAFADHYFVMQRGRIVQRGGVANTSVADVVHLIQV